MCFVKFSLVPVMSPERRPFQLYTLPNPRSRSPLSSGLVNWALAGAAGATIRAWDGYAVTPLLSLPGLASEAGVAGVMCKYEGNRFGIGSFKALGGAYAVSKALAARCAAPSEVTFVTASDGNHGLSVAWGARRFG